MHTQQTTLHAHATAADRIGSFAWHRQRTHVDDASVARRHGKIARAIRRELQRRRKGH